MAHTEPGFVLVSCEHIEDPTNLKRVRYFCFYPASKKTSFGFCSCSELLQLKSIEKKPKRKRKLLSPQDRYSSEKGGKLEVFYVSKFVLNCFNMNFDVFRVVEWLEVRVKKRKFRAELRTPTNISCQNSL